MCAFVWCLLVSQQGNRWHSCAELAQIVSVCGCVLSSSSSISPFDLAIILFIAQSSLSTPHLREDSFPIGGHFPSLVFLIPLITKSTYFERWNCMLGTLFLWLHLSCLSLFALFRSFYFVRQPVRPLVLLLLPLHSMTSARHNCHSICLAIGGEYYLTSDSFH